MKKTINFAAVALLLLTGCFAASAQKKAPDYKITAIHITPFDSQTGKFQDEIKVGDGDRSFFNDLSIALLVVVEISGKTDTFESGRMTEITVMEGKKLKKKQVMQIGIPNEDGKYFAPLWLDRSMCSGITITARLLGQKTVSRTVRKVPFMCGE